MRDRWNHEPARRSAVSQTAIDTLNSAFIEATGDAASTIGNARLRALQRSVAASACACLPVCATGLRATPPKEWTLGQFAEHENDVDRLPARLGDVLQLTLKKRSRKQASLCHDGQ